MPKFDDIKASLFTKVEWKAIDRESQDGEESLHDNAFVETSTLTDRDDLVNDGSLLKEIPVCGFFIND